MFWISTASSKINCDTLNRFFALIQSINFIINQSILLLFQYNENVVWLNVKLNFRNKFKHNESGNLNVTNCIETDNNWHNWTLLNLCFNSAQIFHIMNNKRKWLRYNQYSISIIIFFFLFDIASSFKLATQMFIYSSINLLA